MKNYFKSALMSLLALALVVEPSASASAGFNSRGNRVPAVSFSFFRAQALAPGVTMAIQSIYEVPAAASRVRTDAAEAIGSMYGDLQHYLKKFRIGFGEPKFRRSALLTLNGGQYLQSHLLDGNDDTIPAAPELRDVLRLHLELHKRSGFEFPIEAIEFVRGQSMLDSDLHEHQLFEGERKTLIEVRPMESRPGKYRALIHADAVENNPVYKKDPYVFWSLFVLHETAEFGGGVSHKDLEEAGLAWNADPDISILDLYRRFAALNHQGPPGSSWPKVASMIYQAISDHELRSLLFLNDYARRYLRENMEKEEMVSTGLTNKHEPSMIRFTEKDYKTISSFAWRRRLTPTNDFRMAELRHIDEFNRASISLDEISETAEMRLQGKFVEEWYAGGAGNRMALDQLEKKGQLTKAEAALFYFAPIGKITGDDLHDPIAWGPRMFLRYNQSIRVLAAKYGGYSVDQALGNQRFIIHVSQDEIDRVMQDFKEHDFYGFSPKHIYFSADVKHHHLSYDPRTHTFEPVPDDRVPMLVYGHGPATERIIRKNDARRSGESIRMQSSIAEAILETLHEPILRQRRINDLKNLNANPIDLGKDAYAVRKIRSGHYLLFEMVRNPPLIKTPGADVVFQKGGFPQIVREKSLDRIVFLDGLALKDEATAKMSLDAQEKAQKRNEPPLINLMGGYASLEPYAKSLEGGLPVYFDIATGSDGKPLRGPEEQLIVKPQWVTGDASEDRALRTIAYYEEGSELEDFKQRSYSQELSANKKLKAMRDDPAFLAVALRYGFSPEIPGTLSDPVKRALTQVQDSKSDASVAEVLNLIKETLSNPPGAALRPTEAHAFLGIMSASLLMAAIAQAPALLLYGMLPWVVAAIGQEIAVFWHALVTRDTSVLTSFDPIAWYDFTKQRESGATSPFAHAHEMARALTQSRSAVIPRIVAPLTLALAVLDDLVAIIFRLSISDQPTLTTLETRTIAVEKLLTDPFIPALRAASDTWTRLWIGMQAMWKNSNTRQQAAELAVRQSLAVAA